MSCVKRLNYNYYYLAFDVVRESNYKMWIKKRGDERKAGSAPSRVVKSNLCYWENRLKSTALNVLLQITFS